MNWLKRVRGLSALFCAFLMIVSVLFTWRLDVKRVFAEEIGQNSDSFVYFYNNEKWRNVGAYIYGDKGELLGGWGSSEAETADELGDDWLKVGVSEEPPYSIIFYN